MLGTPQTPPGAAAPGPRLEKRAHRVNYSGITLAPPAAASEKGGNGARTPRAPAGRTLHPLMNSYHPIFKRQEREQTSLFKQLPEMLA